MALVEHPDPRTNPANLCPWRGSRFRLLAASSASHRSRGLSALRALIRRWGKLCECLLEINRDRNLVIQRSRSFPRAGDYRMRAGKTEISRNRRLALDHVAETGDAVLLAAIHHHRK